VPLDLFPTPAELGCRGELHFGVQKFKLTDVIAKFPGKPFAVVVFACEYRPAPETTHRQHADMAFARTGECARGKSSRPAMYRTSVAFILKVPRKPLASLYHRPDTLRIWLFNYWELPRKSISWGVQTMEKIPTRTFWVPVHKLFPGAECLEGLNLSLNFKSFHVNEKIFRAQKLLGITTRLMLPLIESPRGLRTCRRTRI